MLRVLILAANPLETDALRLDAELRAIDQAVRQGELRDLIDLRSHWAVRIDDLQELLLRYRPHIVHFSGHGDDRGDLLVESESGTAVGIPPAALAGLFGILRDNIRCVIFNACNTEQQATAIVEHIDCVIGMTEEIPDSSAIAYSAAFYGALAYGKNIKTAFDLGCARLRIVDEFEANIPKLYSRIDPARITIAPARARGHLVDGNDAGGTRPGGVDNPIVASSAAVRWATDLVQTDLFVGRDHEIARLNQWASDPRVQVLAINSWAGAGKTALAVQWLKDGGASHRSSAIGVFTWSFYGDSSADNWANSLLNWASSLGFHANHAISSPAGKILALTRSAPIVLLLDGLEVMQEAPTGANYGRLLDGILREVLTGMGRTKSGSLAILTSRFPFADLDAFDGTTARVLDLQELSLSEGIELLTRKGSSLSTEQCATLVADVDGHALAVAKIGSILAEHSGDDVFDHLRMKVRSATRGGGRVARVLEYYSDRLDESHRYLVAAVSLFVSPVTPSQLVTLAAHPTLNKHLGSWDARSIQVAARGPLSGLLSWLPSGLITAHPLVRESFRPLALGATQVAVDITLTDAPHGTVSTRNEALRVVEAIELCLDGDLWVEAEELHKSRLGGGGVLRNLPARRLAQRVSTAFVATPHRRAMCQRRLRPSILGGGKELLFVMHAGIDCAGAGDLDTARFYLDEAVRLALETKSSDLGTTLHNLADCLGIEGKTIEALQAAKQAFTDRLFGHVYMGWTYDMAGETLLAEQHFIRADEIEYDSECHSEHLHSLRGNRWGSFLMRTGRVGAAHELAALNRMLCGNHRMNEDVASTEVLMARLDLLRGNTRDARRWVDSAIGCFRAGDSLIDLADALNVVAECFRITKDYDGADERLDESLSIAVPRRAIPIQIEALTLKAKTAADRSAKIKVADLLQDARDAADSAYRLSTVVRPLPWLELLAMQAQSHVDLIEGVDHGWVSRSTMLYSKLVPKGLDPDPLATVEAKVDGTPPSLEGIRTRQMLLRLWRAKKRGRQP